MVQYGTNSDKHLTRNQNAVNVGCLNIKGTFGWLHVGYDEVIRGYALYLYQDQLYLCINNLLFSFVYVNSRQYRF